MKRFAYFFILLVTVMGFFAPVGVQIISPTNSVDFSSGNVQSSHPRLALSLESHVAEAAFIQSDCKEKGPIGQMKCGVLNGLLDFFELIWFQVTQIAAAITAMLVDFFLIHSISSSTYQSGIIEAGWEILRDFVNIVFIFALLIIAFNMVLGRGDAKNKEALIKTILVALVINFSLFITYAVIDSSNIFARVFYNKIETVEKINLKSGEDDSGNELNKFFDGYSGVKSPSIALLSTFNPQKILTNNNGQKGYFESFIIVFFAGLINILIIYVFFSVMLLFLGRTVGLMLLGIFAPLAFASLTIPGATGIKWVGFTSWWKQLLSLTFMAPIYLMFLYLIAKFATNSGIMASIANTGTGKGSVLTSILSTVLPFALIAILLMTTLKVTKGLAGELGSMVVDYTKKAVGGAVAAGSIVATGGVAGAGVLTRAAGAVTGNKSFEESGKRMMAFKADVTKMPGFKSLVGSQMSNTIGKVTGKSALGHEQALRERITGGDSKNSVFGSEYDAIKKKRDQADIKAADEAAAEAERKAKAGSEADYYQARIQEDINKKDPAYIKAVEDLEAAEKELKESKKAVSETSSLVNGMKKPDPKLEATKADYANKITVDAAAQAAKAAAETLLNSMDKGDPDLAAAIADLAAKEAAADKGRLERDAAQSRFDGMSINHPNFTSAKASLKAKEATYANAQREKTTSETLLNGMNKSDPGLAAAQADFDAKEAAALKTLQEKDEAKIKLDGMEKGDPGLVSARAQLAAKEADLNKSYLNQQRTESVLESTAGYKSEAGVKKLTEERKEAGKKAATQARVDYASYIANRNVGKNDPVLANRILGEEKPKGNSLTYEEMEKIIEAGKKGTTPPPTPGPTGGTGGSTTP